MANRGGKAGAQRPQGPNMGNLLNLERVPNLAPKFANKLGKTAAGYAVIYSGSGVEVQVQSMLGPNGALVRAQPDGTFPTVPLVEFERRVALHNQPSEADRISALRRKYELRLRQEFPAAGPASGSEAHVQAWLASRPFAERVALMMSQKDFDKSYPQGFRPATAG